MALEQLSQRSTLAEWGELQPRDLTVLEHVRDKIGGRQRQVGRGLQLALIGALVVLTVVYVVSRLAMLLTLPIFFDEAHYTLSALLIGRDPLHTSPFIEVAYWGVPPLFTWIAAPLTRLVEDPLRASRIASVAIGAFGMLGIWKCGRAVAGLPVALLAVALYVLCPFVLLYNRMAMVDGLLAVIGAFALLAAIRLAREPSVRTALMLGLCCAAAIFTKIFGPLDLALAAAAIIAAPATARRQVARMAALSVLIGLGAFVILLAAPGGQSLILVAMQQQGGSTTLVARGAAQLVTIGEAYWLYMTPPILVLALVGAAYSMREPGARVLLVWAVLSWLPFVVIHLSPRYLLSGAIPLVLLAARGAVELVKTRTSRAHHGVGFRAIPMRRALATALVVLTAGTCAWEDRALIASPPHAALLAGDREQYISGWPAGYALVRALADLHRLTHGQSVTLISPVQNPPADALAVLAGRDPHIQLLYRDLAELQRPAAPRSYPALTFIVVCRPVGQQIDVRRAGLHLAVAEPNVGGDGGVYLYTYTGDRPARPAAEGTKT